MPHCSHFMKNKKTGPTGHAALFFLPRPSTDRERLRSGIIFEILFFQSSAAPVREFLLLVAGLQGAASEPPPSLQWKCSISALSLFSLACLSHCTADKDKLNSFFFSARRIVSAPWLWIGKRAGATKHRNNGISLHLIEAFTSYEYIQRSCSPPLVSTDVYTRRTRWEDWKFK